MDAAALGYGGCGFLADQSWSACDDHCVRRMDMEATMQAEPWQSGSWFETVRSQAVLEKVELHARLRPRCRWTATLWL
jgi:hypothetical protein